MIVEILGVYEHNKGALLMLEAIRERIGEAFPAAVLAVPTAMPRAYREQFGVLGVVRPAGMRTRLMARLPRALLRRRGLVRQDDVDVILDASGFGYGDFWGEGKLRRRLLGTLREWKRPGKAAILLPQALGPFEAPQMKSAIQEVVQRLDLVFVRDAVSLGYMRAAGVEESRLSLAPDFTNLLHPPLDPRFEHLVGASFVIPNDKMVSGARASARPAYVRLLAFAMSEIAASGRSAHLLIHEGAQDRALAEEVRVLLGGSASIIDLPSALDTKAVIAKADLIVTSRFHGLVSALSNAVPALACGWSHKYEELLGDYGAAAFSLDVSAEGDWKPRIAALLSAARSDAFRSALMVAADEQKRRTQAMWDRTIAAIALATGGGR